MIFEEKKTFFLGGRPIFRGGLGSTPRPPKKIGRPPKNFSSNIICWPFFFYNRILIYKIGCLPKTRPQLHQN